ncbi:hypothetical protein PZB75_16500 [Streptomyces sp. AM 4-1-1]|uniref:hypothetical protein n=1 Tax=Streptomyces sp. AM 4-1-1 TaxID=3028710 RepID=UPI0023B9962D|nr:hypothetical protein [Streptomyces sp. AM 4-1-1]WEH34809.1 hypothetical protein PZB75_16500 [Streptomyces sp. AM 4-1-1]
MGDDGAVIVDVSNYELVWPTSLFVSEGERILRTPTSQWEDRAEWLLTEAMVGSTAVTDFREVDAFRDPWATTRESRTLTRTRENWFSELISRASEIRPALAPRPYWPQRQGRGLIADGSTDRDARRDFARIVADFADNGYLVEQFGEECVDGSDDLPDASALIERRLGIPDLWPLAPATWDEDTFYGLIEVFHDLVSRPRRRSFHSYSGCGWHHSEFHNGPARILYRAKINDLLREAGIEYELAAEGEDLGRLVAITDDARRQLVHHVLKDSPPAVTDRVRHAIALFRARDASLESKRSAIVAAVGILEERRALIREDLGKPDDGALFEIANRFGLRHRRADQLANYSDAFLDWIFWWYLATVELTNKLIEAAEPPAVGPASEPPFRG